MRVGVSFAREDKLGPYLEALRTCGLEAVAISPAQRRGLDGLGGLLLTGGGDVDPFLYGVSADSLANHVLRERDELEQALIVEAEQRNVPILGICRGLQMLNVARGGTLHRHIDGHKDVEHRVRLETESMLQALVGAQDYTVNSRHHQAVDGLGRGLVVTARAADGIIEALEDPERRFVVAVQWHPEDRPDTRDSQIFRAFARAVCG
jgi:putative glutamine amidotransferase